MERFVNEVQLPIQCPALPSYKLQLTALKTKETREVHPLKAPELIYPTDSGIISEIILLHPLNAA